MEAIKGRLVVGFLRLFALLPWRAVQGLGAAIGWLMWKLPNGSREVVRINLAKCFPELDAAARERLTKIVIAGLPGVVLEADGAADLLRQVPESHQQGRHLFARDAQQVPFHRCVPPILLRELSDATKRCRGCEAGLRRCWEENVRSYLLREKQVSARPLWSTRSCAA